MGGRVFFAGTDDPIGAKEISWWEETTESWFGQRARGVFLSGAEVSDLSPLSEINILEWLQLSRTQVSDLSPLAELKNVETLYLYDTQVSDLSPLSELKNTS